MKSGMVMLSSMACILAMLSAESLAGTVVRETSNGDLMVTEFNGKPPHKRRIISAEDQTDFSRFEAIKESVVVAVTTNRHRGPRGKLRPAQQASFERIPQTDITEFARFEESEARGDSRMWRGAPGKGRR